VTTPDAPKPPIPALVLGAVPGATPGKWIRIWEERFPRRVLTLQVVEQVDQDAELRSGAVTMCLVREFGASPHFHLIPLYEEQPVVVLPKAHPLAERDRLALDDLDGEVFLQRPSEIHGWDGPLPPALTDEVLESLDLGRRVALVADEAGVLIVPMSIARLHHRRDVVARPIDGLPSTRIGLAWLRTTEGPAVDDFIGVVRGRTSNSTRGPSEPERTPAKKPVAKRPAARKSGSSSAARKPTRKGGPPRKRPR
jgi:DNA-binding transcriptional LysR family regulator